MTTPLPIATPSVSGAIPERSPGLTFAQIFEVNETEGISNREIPMERSR